MNDLNKCNCTRCNAKASNTKFSNGAGWLCAECGELNLFNQSMTLKSHTPQTEVTCTNCQWSGTEKEQWFLNGWHVCPRCNQPDFLVSGDALDELNEIETP